MKVERFANNRSTNLFRSHGNHEFCSWWRWVGKENCCSEFTNPGGGHWICNRAVSSVSDTVDTPFFTPEPGCSCCCCRRLCLLLSFSPSLSFRDCTGDEVDVWSEAIAESLLKKENKERCCAMFLQITLANLLEYINLGVSLKQIPPKVKKTKQKADEITSNYAWIEPSKLQSNSI